MHINWTQVLIAFFAGVFGSAMVKNVFGGLKSKVAK